MKYLVAGSTGLIGKSLINYISTNNEVIALTRRNFSFPKNIQQTLVDFDDDYDIPNADHLFICLGFPVKLADLFIMKKTVKKQFYKVDYEYFYMQCGRVVKLDVEFLIQFHVQLNN